MMERHMNQGVINREIRRPEPALIERFKKYPSVLVYDAMGGRGAMYHGIKPMEPGMRCAGPACTVHSMPGDALYVVIACDVAHPGDVVVVDNGRFHEGNSIGDGMAKYFYERTRIAGFVSDGGVRDVEGIIRIGLPTWGTAVSVKHTGSNALGAVNIPIVCGGQVVYPGDVIVADDDGVVVVPFDLANETADRSDALIRLYAELRERIQKGENLRQLSEWYGACRKEITNSHERNQ